jgi:hypothetical protein
MSRCLYPLRNICTATARFNSRASGLDWIKSLSSGSISLTLLLSLWSHKSFGIAIFRLFRCPCVTQLRNISNARTLTFIETFYEPIVRTYGSIYEKTSGDASLAHGWSIGIAALLVEEVDLLNP